MKMPSLLSNKNLLKAGIVGSLSKKFALEMTTAEASRYYFTQPTHVLFTALNEYMKRASKNRFSYEMYEMLPNYIRLKIISLF